MKSFGSRSAASLTILQNHLPAAKLWRSWSTVAHWREVMWLTRQQPGSNKEGGGLTDLHANAYLIKLRVIRGRCEPQANLTSPLRQTKSQARYSRAFITVETLFPSILPKSSFFDLLVLTYPAHLSYASCIALEILQPQCLLHLASADDGIS